MANESVWSKRGAGDISRQQFNLIMGICLLGGLLVTAVGAYYTTGWAEFVPAHEGVKAHANWVGPIPFWPMVIGVVVCTFAGVIIAGVSSNPLVSLIGYGMVCGPFGLLLGPTVGMYTPESVIKVLFVTGGVTGVTMLVGVCIPESLKSWGGYLFGGLTFLLLASFAFPILHALFPSLPIKHAMTLLDVFGALLFSAYIIYDMNQAQHVEPTVDNAVDTALALYLDILNLFLELLKLMGDSKGESSSSDD